MPDPPSPQANRTSGSVAGAPSTPDEPSTPDQPPAPGAPEKPPGVLPPVTGPPRAPGPPIEDRAQLVESLWGLRGDLDALLSWLLADSDVSRLIAGLPRATEPQRHRVVGRLRTGGMRRAIMHSQALLWQCST
jgi:hypothetical protein